MFMLHVSHLQKQWVVFSLSRLMAWTASQLQP